MPSVSSASVIAEELQPLFSRAARERGNAGRILAPIVYTKRSRSTQLVVDDDFLIDDQEQGRNVLNPVDEDAPITGGRMLFTTFDVKQKKYGPGELTLSEDLREDIEDMDVPLEMLAARMLAQGSDDIHASKVYEHLTNEANYQSGLVDTIGNVNDRSVAIGRLLEAAILANEEAGGALSHIVMNRKTALALNQSNDVSGKDRVAIAKSSAGQATLGYEGMNRLREWMRSNFELELVIPKTQVKVGGVRQRKFGAFISLVLVQSGAQEASFLKTYAKRNPGIPMSDTDLGVVKRYQTWNPDTTKMYAELKFSIVQPTVDPKDPTAKSPHGYLLKGVTYS